MPVRATCPSCGKRYRVPHADEEWSCKACDERLEFDEEEPAGERAAPEPARDLHDVNRDVRRALKSVGMLRALFSVLMLVSGIPLAFYLLHLFAEGPVREETLAAVVSYGLSFAFALGGFFDVRRRPFGWALAVAILYALSHVLSLLSGEATIVRVGLIALMQSYVWFCVLKALHLKRLLREHPEAYLARKGRGELQRAAMGMDPEESLGRVRRTRDRSRSRREGGRTALIAVGLATAVVAAATVMVLVGRPSSPAGPAEGFRVAWNSGDVDTAARHFLEDRRDKLRGGLERMAERKGWLENGFPQAGEAELQAEEDRALVVFPTPEGQLVTRWRWDGERWGLASLRAP